MPTDIEMRKLTNELKDLNKHLFQIHRVLSKISVDLSNGQRKPEPIQNVKGAYDEMRAAIDDAQSRKRYEESTDD